MKYAVIALQGKQYKVEVGTELTVDRVKEEEGSKKTIDSVLLIADDKDVAIGTPSIEKARVVAEVVKHLRGEKIRVFKFKAKSRYRKAKGHRQEESVLKIVSITA